MPAPLPCKVCLSKGVRASELPPLLGGSAYFLLVIPASFCRLLSALSDPPGLQASFGGRHVLWAGRAVLVVMGRHSSLPASSLQDLGLWDQPPSDWAHRKGNKKSRR